MAEKQSLSIHWTDSSVSGSLSIKKYLLEEFSQREVDNFYKLLEAFEKIVLTFPRLYPKSIKNSKTHRAVLSKQLSVFYTVSKIQITVIAVLDTRTGYSKWP
jgi:hypothetical protein